MVERMTASAAVPRFRMRLFAVLAAVSVALAVIGLYGILSYQVNQRRKETAVRRALGATSPAILGAVVGSALWLTTAGMVIGLAAALGLTRSLEAFLFGVAPDDPSAFVLAAAVLLCAATAASVMPALRAVADDPLAVLRED
jgi:ABC-type antimicrobial peptide transport system permease subunit